MDKDLFVQNIKKYCEQRGVKPTVACRESGVGASFISKIEGRGSIPSVEKVYMLASYLGVTINDLVGADIITSSRGPEQPYLVRQYNLLSKEAQMEVMAFIEFKAAQAVKPVEGSIPMEELGDTRPAGAKELEAQKEKEQND